MLKINMRIWTLLDIKILTWVSTIIEINIADSITTQRVTLNNNNDLRPNLSINKADITVTMKLTDPAPKFAYWAQYILNPDFINISVE